MPKELKTVSVSYRVSPRFKRALQIAAASVNRTQTNFLETLLFNYCDANGIDVDPTQKVVAEMARHDDE
jgi:hypothetical protein